MFEINKMEISNIKNHTVASLYTNYDIQTFVWKLNLNSFLQENIFKVSVCLKMTILKHRERKGIYDKIQC